MLEEKIRYTLKELLESQSLDKEVFPTTQRFMYETANLYMISMDMEKNLISDICFDDEEEEEYVQAVFYKSLLEQIIDNMSIYFLEDVVSIPMRDPNHLCEAVIIKDENQPYAIIGVFGVLDNAKENNVPECIKRVNVSSFEKNVEVMSRMFNRNIKIVRRYHLSQLELKQSQEKGKRLEEDYVRSAILTEIVQLLQSEEDIVDVVEEILYKVCTHLSVDSAGLYRINADNTTISMIGEWVDDDSFRKISDSQNLPTIDFPFMRSESYVISSNTELNKEQQKYMEKQNIKATIVLPIVVDKKAIMYLAFSMVKKERIWDINAVRFLSDTRKIIQSIVSKRIAQNSLTSSMESMKDILENIGCGIIVVDPASRGLLFQNHLFEDDLKESLRDKNLISLFCKGEHEVELYLEDLNRWIMINHSKIRWVDDREVELYTIYDITHKKLIERKIEKSSNTDFLTGLYNRKRCEQDLQGYLDEIKKNHGCGALLFLDLDDFKHINDGLGHQYGDILLKVVSNSLQRIDGLEKNCYRVGGDEFVIIVSSTNYERLGTIIESIETVFSHSWFLKGADYYCTMSMGVCIFPTDADNVEDIMRKADLALYEAKKHGKNQAVFYNDKVQKNDVKRLDMEKCMRKACLHPEKEFEVYYQPIIDVESGGNQCVGAEALVRWNSEELGRMSPTEFIPLAEYLGLIKNIGDYVLREACKACKRWNDMGHPNYKINVNFSVVQLIQPNMKERIKEILDETGLEPHHLTLEVTESLAINDITYMKKLLDGIRESGVRVALDDFGTGYSSLNHIHELPIDVIKVDRCFVENVGKDQYSQVFVKMVSELAKTMGMNVCVEGVEEELQYRAVLEHGVNMIQGYYFAEPVPLREFEIKYVD